MYLGLYLILCTEQQQFSRITLLTGVKGNLYSLASISNKKSSHKFARKNRRKFLRISKKQNILWP